jgi:PST family polysaccharide transporter
VLLGPAWTSVVLPFRLFTCSLLFRMSSKISDACTKAAGAVYSRALRQGTYAAMVLVGAFIGQHWGLGGVATAVSIAMGINWLSMANLSRSVTGLSWGRFVRAHAPGALSAAVIGGTVSIAAEAGRAAHLGKIPLLITAALTAAAVIYAALRLRSKLFLGAHGTWASKQAGKFLRQASQRLAGQRGANANSLASSGRRI